MECFRGIHILYVVLSILFILILFGIAIFSAIFHTEIFPTRESGFGKLDDKFEMMFIGYRVIIIIFTTFVFNVLL